MDNRSGLTDTQATRPTTTSQANEATSESPARRTPNYLYAQARILENEARNLMDQILDGKVPDSEKAAVKAEREALYRRIADLRSNARHIEELDRQIAAEDTDDLVPNTASADQIAVWPDEVAALAASATTVTFPADEAGEDPTLRPADVTQPQAMPQDWSATGVTMTHPVLVADIEDVFAYLDPREITRTVLDHRQVDMPRAIEALDDVFGEIYDPYADEDDA